MNILHPTTIRARYWRRLKQLRNELNVQGNLKWPHGSLQQYKEQVSNLKLRKMKRTIKQGIKAVNLINREEKKFNNMYDLASILDKVVQTKFTSSFNQFWSAKKYIPYTEYYLNENTGVINQEDYEKIIKNDMLSKIKKFLTEQIKVHTNIRYIISSAIVTKNGDEEKTNYKYIRASNEHDLTTIDQKILDLVDDHFNYVDGLSYVTPNKAYITVSVSKALNGMSYKPLPLKLMNKKAIINPKNKDNKCFMWSVLIGLYGINKKNASEITKFYKNKIDSLKWDNICFPTGLNDITQFEKNNDIGINIFSYDDEDETIANIRCSKIKNPLNLMLYDGHYSLIKSIDRLINSRKNRGYMCNKCLKRFRYKNQKNKHETICTGEFQENILMPSIKKDGEKPRLKHVINYKQSRFPVCIVADFEACMNEENKHVACSYGYYIVTDPGFPIQHNKLITKYGTPKDFIDELLEKTKPIMKHLYNPMFKNVDVKTLLSEDEEKQYQESIECYLCNKKYNTDDIKVRDHCHYTGKYRGSAHKKCNLAVRDQKNIKIPVMFHNAVGYDTHHILDSISQYEGKKYELDGICLNNEKMKTLQINNLLILDTMAFMNTSLSKLMDNLEDKDKKRIKEEYGDDSDLLMKKQIFPYEYKWMDHLDEPVPMNKKIYYSSLYDTTPTDDDMKHIKNVCDKLKIKTFREYHDLYLGIDVLGLVDVWEEFRNMSLKQDGLDPVYFISLPSLSLAGGLKCTGATPELLTDQKMYEMFERGKRGGVSMAVLRYAKANNPKLPDYDKKIKESYIRYWDMNNLYGGSMVQPLPYENFEWGDIKKIDLYNDIYTAEVDLEYPKELWEMHNDLPLAPENIEITKDMISDISKSMIDKRNNKKGDIIDGRFTKSRKLVGHFRTRYNYVVHHKALKYYLSMGLKVSKIHNVITYKEKPWLKAWIEKNTKYRALAKNDFEKDFYKLKNNAIFGKTMENVRGRTKAKFVTNKEQLKKEWNKNTVYSPIRMSENMMIINHKKETTQLNKTIYAGQAILDLSKVDMFKFHYDIIKPNYTDARLCMTDTDSLCYWLPTNNLDEQIKNNFHDYFDCSNLSKDHMLYDVKNKKQLGKMKDEAEGYEISEICTHRSKVYCYKKYKNGVYVTDRKCKGVNKRISKMLNIDDYKNVIENQTIKKMTYNKISSKKHSVSTININKKCLSSYDDKRYMISKYDSKPYH